MSRLRQRFLARQRATSGKPTQLPMGCLALFGLPFLIGGIVTTWICFSGYTDYLATQRWEETPCWIESAELKKNSDSDGTTYRAVATYRYHYAGQTWQGDRVSIHSGGDNIGRFQQEVHRELSRHVVDGPRDHSKTFRCYVNPANPAESVLYRTLRWQMQAFMSLFALTFPVAGAGLIAGGLYGRREQLATKALTDAHPDEPWRWRREWASNTLPEASNPWATGLRFYTIWAALVITPLIWTTAATGAFSREPASWLVGIFVLLWCIPAGFTLRHLRMRRMIGKTTLELTDCPVAPGSLLKGFLWLQQPTPARLDALVTVACNRLTTVKRGDSVSTTTEPLWTGTLTVSPADAVREMQGFRIPVEIQLPADAPETSASLTDSTRHEWKLQFTIPGTPVKTSYLLPVFHRDRSTAAIAATATDSTDLAGADPPLTGSILHQALATLPERLAARKIRAEFDPDGLPLTIVCPPARNLALGLFLIVFNLLWTAAAIFLVVQNAPLIFRIVWPLSCAAIWIAILWTFLHKRTVTLHPGRIHVVNQLGPFRRATTIDASQITTFTHDTHLSSNNQNFYRVRVENLIGRKTTLADNLTDSTTAQALAKALETWRDRREG